MRANKIYNWQITVQLDQTQNFINTSLGKLNFLNVNELAINLSIFKQKKKKNNEKLSCVLFEIDKACNQDGGKKITLLLAKMRARCF